MAYNHILWAWLSRDGQAKPPDEPDIAHEITREPSMDFVDAQDPIKRKDDIDERNAEPVQAQNKAVRIPRDRSDFEKP